MSATKPPSDIRVTTDEQVRRIYQRINNWGRWGEEDELGTLNYITPEVRIAAARLIREGVAIGCGRPLDTKPSPMNNLPAQHHMVAAGDLAPERGPGVTYDHIAVFPHGQAQTHLDALCHISDAQQMYNGRSASLVRSSGSAVCSIAVASDGIVSRGVLLDIAASRSVPFLAPDQPVLPADLDRAADQAGLEIREGDVLIYRTGRHERRETLGPACERSAEGRGQVPGLAPESLEWIHDRKVALLASDCVHDTLPAPFREEWIPIHVGCEVHMGILLLHSLDLAVLTQACQERNRYEFFFSVAPLRVEGATASPVNPIAIF